jgi:hypothetical protein
MKNTIIIIIFLCANIITAFQIRAENFENMFLAAAKPLEQIHSLSCKILVTGKLGFDSKHQLIQNIIWRESDQGAYYREVKLEKTGDPGGLFIAAYDLENHMEIRKINVDLKKTLRVSQSKPNSMPAFTSAYFPLMYFQPFLDIIDTDELPTLKGIVNASNQSAGKKINLEMSRKENMISVLCKENEAERKVFFSLDHKLISCESYSKNNSHAHFKIDDFQWLDHIFNMGKIITFPKS